ncbi:hypothetical protein Vretifemale_17970 [Volvox reticuliferus]|uniref:Uncharacterized protein n=1 Tax=Volvox reticuliferus TaxID=1737510 RepID=A0A8J4CWG1_9CHLO|nr:hypothetical protein Vretifemale_17970 [Volvox reticuliferus]
MSSCLRKNLNLLPGTQLRRKAKEHLSTKQFEEALRCLDIAIELHSTSYKLYRMRSIALACLHQYERAAADADRVVELAPHIMDGHYHKGFALFHLKDYAGAAHAFQQGLKLNPTDKTLRQGFWDAIALVSQSRTDSDAVLQMQGLQLDELGSPLPSPTAAPIASMNAASSPTAAATGLSTGVSIASRIASAGSGAARPGTAGGVATQAPLIESASDPTAPSA